MEKEIKNILILPARFLEKQERGYVIRCLIDKDHMEDRLFENYSLQGIENPDLVFIGIITGVGVMQINFCDANDYRDLFEKKWNILTK